ncbi:Txe/YoeB family addiction module toxin [Paracandidimonas soli]|uniref:Putative mRNA interferase YoeB n=1 Tax=Paracandidimonas soli TaxID=1917182 RepID=A0A4R3V6J1_9BURK|nr:Txe/YoeB family addiction module toxin [Paracandidimonas soli]TCV00677.1 toxin YoeB [Paracandidimonas soli]
MQQKQKNKSAAKQGLICWTEHAWDEYRYWLKTDREKVGRINALIEDCQRHPFLGMGKPEPLKGTLSGYWSRRIDREHRLVYLAEDGNLYIIQCLYHY